MREMWRSLSGGCDMRMYLYLQSKRTVRYLGSAICAVLVLLVVLLGAFGLIMGQDQSFNKIRVAITGDTQNAVLNMGITALESFDSTQYTVELLLMDQQEAAKALEQRQLTGYVVIPEGFMEAALHGSMQPLEFVSHADAADLGTVFKKELTTAVATLVLESQRGVYGMVDALRDHDVALGDLANKAGMDYMGLVLARDDIYTVEELGISNGLDLTGTLLCGLSVLLLLLACLPFAPLLVRRDVALSAVLASRKKPVWAQTVCDYLAYSAALMVVCLAVLVICWLVCCCTGVAFCTFGGIWQLLWQLLPVVLMAAGLSFMLYSMATELISGVLLQFFVTAAVCFISGCIYPISFFPVKLQQVVAWLPTGTARTYLSCVATDRTSFVYGLVLVGESLLFLSLAVWMRSRKIHRKRG